MWRGGLVWLFAMSLLLSACASGGGTTVVLLPDRDGKVGRVTVKSADQTRTLDQAYSSAVTAPGGFLAPSLPVPADKLSQDYAELFAAEPAKPMAFMLYFQSGTTELVASSMAQVTDVAEQVRLRLPTEVTIIGHTDTRGSDAINDKLSQQRALAVEKILRERIPQLGIVTLRSFGAKELLVPTPPNVDEPRNRRVEIFIL